MKDQTLDTFSARFLIAQSNSYTFSAENTITKRSRGSAGHFILYNFLVVDETVALLDFPLVQTQQGLNSCLDMTGM